MKLIGPDGKYLHDLIREATLIHHQDAASATWTINHSLSKYPSVTLVDSSGRVIFANVEYTSTEQVVVTFNGTTTGKAYLN